jgi:transposase InsO family protein
VTILDDATKLSVVHPIAHKSDAAQCVRDTIVLLENAVGSKVKAVRSDRGGEYLGSALQDFFAKKGITPQRTSPYTPE